ncbi:isochorismatase family protein [Burkholderia pseudomallei S13]|nr:isochorismatase family protein [Burkholderia pseudomallei S13]EDU06637.1 isochorismatase family protein [Burkholderia pseudomallei 1655]
MRRISAPAAGMRSVPPAPGAPRDALASDARRWARLPRSPRTSFVNPALNGVTPETVMSDPKLEVLTPHNSQLIFIDQQPQMAFGVQSIDRQTLKNNVVGLAKAAKIFNVPTTITTVESESFSGFTYPELLDVYPDHKLLERSSMNSWDDQKVRDALKANGRRKVVVSGLWTEVCNTTFALCAMAEGGYEIYMVADASGGTSKDAHDYAMQRMIQAGVVPVTWQQVLLEWQRDWAHRDTYDAVMTLVKEHSGAYGMGVDYAYTMVHKAAQRTANAHDMLAPVPAR